MAAALDVLPSLSNKQDIGWNQDKKQDWDFFLVCDAEADLKKKKKKDDARLRKLTAVYTAYLFVSTARNNSIVFSQMLGQWEGVHNPTAL